LTSIGTSIVQANTIEAWTWITWVLVLTSLS